MRELTESEMKTLFDKLANYTGRSLTNLISPPSSDSAPSERFVFRLHESRVYYLKLALANLAVSVARENLLSLGTCLGKFTKTGKFRLHITALDIIAPHARYKIWIKPNGEMPFLVGTFEKGRVLFYHDSYVKVFYPLRNSIDRPRSLFGSRVKPNLTLLAYFIIVLIDQC